MLLDHICCVELEASNSSVQRINQHYFSTTSPTPLFSKVIWKKYISGTHSGGSFDFESDRIVIPHEMACHSTVKHTSTWGWIDRVLPHYNIQRFISSLMLFEELDIQSSFPADWKTKLSAETGSREEQAHVLCCVKASGSLGENPLRLATLVPFHITLIMYFQVFIFIVYCAFDVVERLAFSTNFNSVSGIINDLFFVSTCAVLCEWRFISLLPQTIKLCVQFCENSVLCPCYHKLSINHKSTTGAQL